MSDHPDGGLRQQVPAPNTNSVTTSDNCGGVVTVSWQGDSVSSSNCAGQFVISRTYRAADLCGNSATCAQTITVNDANPPSITCLGTKPTSAAWATCTCWTSLAGESHTCWPLVRSFDFKIDNEPCAHVSLAGKARQHRSGSPRRTRWFCFLSM